MSGRLDGKTALVTGIIGERSIAYAIAKAFHREGARLILSTASEAITERVQKRGLLNELGNPFVIPCNVAEAEEIKSLARQIGTLPLGNFDGIDVVVHAIAFADRDALKGSVLDVGDREFEEALIISALSLQRLLRELRFWLKPRCSVITLDYLGGERVVAPYGLMGPVKALLGSLVKYLAFELGASELRGRVNAISPGPIETTAARGIGGFKSLYGQYPSLVPGGEHVGVEEVGETAVFLASDEAIRITGETIHVDGGAHMIGLNLAKAE